MGLADVVRNAVSVANRITGGLQVNVTHEAYASQDADRKPTYTSPAVTRSALVNYETRRVNGLDGREVLSEALITFLGTVAVNPRDRFTLPGSVTGAIVKTEAFADPQGVGGYVTQVWLGSIASR